MNKVRASWTMNWLNNPLLSVRIKRQVVMVNCSNMHLVCLWLFLKLSVDLVGEMKAAFGQQLNYTKHYSLVWLLRFLLWPVLHHSGSILELVCFPVSRASMHLFLQIYILLGGCLIRLDSLDLFIDIFLSSVRDIDQVCVLNFCWILMDLQASQVNHSQCCLFLSLEK